MAQTYTQREAVGVKKQLPMVTIEYLGEKPLAWKCQEYVTGKDLEICLVKGEKDKFDYDWSRRIFGDWEVNPDESPDKKREWSDMIAHTMRKSPSKDGKLARVKIYDHSNTLLWDGIAQMEKWLEHNSMSKDSFPTAGPIQDVLANIPMPKMLKDASHAQLKALWLKSWGSKMPAGTSGEVAREILLPRMTADQIADVISKEYEAAREAKEAKAVTD